MSNQLITIGSKYTPPTPEQFRDIKKKYRLTDGAVGKLLGLSRRTIRYYVSPKDPRPFPYSQWALLLVIVGEIKPEEFQEHLERVQKNYTESLDEDNA